MYPPSNQKSYIYKLDAKNLYLYSKLYILAYCKQGLVKMVIVYIVTDNMVFAVRYEKPLKLFIFTGIQQAKSVMANLTE